MFVHQSKTTLLVFKRKRKTITKKFTTAKLLSAKLTVIETIGYNRLRQSNIKNETVEYSDETIECSDETIEFFQIIQSSHLLSPIDSICYYQLS